MIIWDTSTEVGPAQLNQSFGFDAIVSDGATQSGDIYPNLGDALTAGHKNILVMPSDYTADGTVTISQSGVRITGASPVISNGSTLTGGARFKRIDITGDHIEVNHIGVLGSTSSGWDIANGTSHLNLNHCWAWGCSGQGFNLTSPDVTTLFRCRSAENDNGFLVKPNNAGADLHSIELMKCWAWQNDGNGITITDAGSDTSGRRMVLVDGCIVRDNCEVWTAAGIYVHSGSAATIVNNQVFNNGHSTPSEIVGNGIYVQAPASGSQRMATLIANNYIRNNIGAGIQLSAASVRVSINGNWARANAYGNWVNCGSSPGYAGRGLTAPGTNVED